MSTLELLSQIPQLPPEQQMEALKHVATLMEAPEYINELIPILANFEVDNNTRQRAAVFFGRMTHMHYECYNGEPAVFNPFLQAFANETDPYIGEQISHALRLIMDCNGEEWTQLVELINHMCSNDNVNTFWIGTKLLINFIPGARNDFIVQMMPMILPLFVKLFTNEPCFLDGFQLFATIQLKEDLVLTQWNAALTEIFGQMLTIFAATLTDEKKERLAYSFANYISQSLKNQIPFTSPIGILEKLIEIARNGQIDISRQHITLYPMSKLIKYHGKELKGAIPTVITAIFTICSSQFQNRDFESEEASRTAISLFENIAMTANSTAFYQLLVSSLCAEPAIPQSFASLCAIYGTINELLEQYEQNIEFVVSYVMSKITLESIAIIEICLKIFADLAEALSDAVKPYVEQILQIAFQLLTQFPNVEIQFEAINLISGVFECIDLEPSYVIPHISTLVGLFSPASEELKPLLMGSIANGILACQDGIEPFVESFFAVIQAGMASQNPVLLASTIEVYGNLLYCANNLSPDFIAQGIEFISTYSQDDDYNLRVCSLNAFRRIADKKNGTLPNSQLEFWTFLLMSAINAAGVVDDDKERNITDYKETDVREAGSALLKSMLKNHPQESLASRLTESLPIHFSIFIDYDELPVALKTIQASVYYLLNINPKDSVILDLFLKIITQKKNRDKVAAVFKAYTKLLNGDQELAKDAAYLPKFLECCLHALSRQLPCQTSKCVDEEERFNFDPELMSYVYSIICASFKVNAQIIPAEHFLGNITALLGKVGSMESLEILGTMGDYVMAGGTVTPEILQYALTQISEIDYSKAPDAIFLIRSLIKMHPEIIASNIQQLTQFFVAQLNVEESPKKYYWRTITNVISAIFDLAQSQQLNQVINLGELMPLILTKLPVKGDYEEAQFIYSSLISFYQANQQHLVEHIQGLFIVLVHTLALKSKTFEKYEFEQETISQIAQTIAFILKTKEEFMQAIPEVLGQDQIKILKFQERYGSLQSA